MQSRHLASLLALGLLFAAGEARAQAPIVAPTPAPSVPGYAPPGAYAPYGGAAPPYAAPPPGYYYYAPMPAAPPMRRRSTGMMAGGIALTALGGVSLVVGTLFYAMGAVQRVEIPPCPANATNCGPSFSDSDPGMKSAGIGLMVGSVVMMGVGIPLTVIGAKKVPDVPDGTEPAQSLVPTVRVGAGRLSATWAF